jgi:outer membrane protein assembly factor BamB
VRGAGWRYTASGALVWSKPIDKHNLDTADDLAVDATGNIFVVGMANDFGSPYYDTYLAEFAPDGSQVWGKKLGARVGAPQRSVAVSSEGKVFVAGSDGHSGAFLVRLTP